jgi:hypothetical protein
MSLDGPSIHTCGDFNCRLIAPDVLIFFTLALGSKFCVRLKEKVSKLAVVSSKQQQPFSGAPVPW